VPSSESTQSYSNADLANNSRSTVTSPVAYPGNAHSPAQAYFVTCRHCGETFHGEHARANLTQHEQSQGCPAQEYSVTCRHCGEKFHGEHARGNLTRHEKSQSCPAPRRAPPSVCSFCGKTYARSDGLRAHIRKRHPDEPVA
jgi:ribosomal protein S27E